MAGFPRSFFGVGESRDSDRDNGESERLQKYEDLVDQDYDPFHHKCGNNVAFSRRGLIATRRTSYAKGIVFSAKPIPVGTMFQVKLLEKEDYKWSGSLVSPCTEYSALYSVCSR